MTDIAVNVAIIENGRILLTQRDDFETWIMPGGGVEVGESVAQAARREAQEEAGLEVELTGLVGIYSRLGNTMGGHIVLFTAKPVGGELRCQPGETITVEWFDFNHLPSPLTPGQEKRIADAIAGRRGVAVSQEITLPEFPDRHLSRHDLVALRDQSGLPRQEFWQQLFRNAVFVENNEAGSPAEPPPWLSWARELFSISQTGFTYCKNEYDLERYRRLQELSAEIIASQTEMEKAAVLASFSMQSGYITPKVDVRGAVIRDGKILLVQERADSCWSMPGGWADLGDSPAEMVAREVWEESGLKVRASKVIAVLDANRIQPFEFYHAYKILFLCELLGGELTPSLETLAVAFFDPQNLPPLSENRTNQRMVAEVLAHVADPARPALFE